MPVTDEAIRAIRALRDDMQSDAEVCHRCGLEGRAAKTVSWIDRLDTLLAASAEPTPQSPDPNCPYCKGSGECSNAQFKCHCRWNYLRKVAEPTTDEVPNFKDALVRALPKEPKR